MENVAKLQRMAYRAVNHSKNRREESFSKNTQWHLREKLYSCFLKFASFFFFKAKAAALIAQLVKKLPAVQDWLVQYLGWGDLLEKG